MSDTASPLAPLPVVAGLLPSTSRAGAVSGRRPGLVGARSRTVGFGVGLGLGARRRHLGVPSTAAGQPIRPPQEWTPAAQAEELESAEAWSPWQVSDRMAAPAIRGLLSAQRDVVAEPRQHRPSVTSATSHRPGRTRTASSQSRSAPTASSTAPSVPAITEDNQIEFADTGHDTGSRGDMLAKLTQLNRLRDGAVPQAKPTAAATDSPTSTGGLPDAHAPGAATRRSAIDPVVPAAPSTIASPIAMPRPIAASAIEFLSSWETQPATTWPDGALSTTSIGSTPDPAALSGILPAAAAALEALRGSRPAATAPSQPSTGPSQLSAGQTVPPAIDGSQESPPGATATSLASAVESSPATDAMPTPAWPGDMAPAERSAPAIAAAEQVRSTRSLTEPAIGATSSFGASSPNTSSPGSAPPAPAPTARVRAQMTTEGQVEFGDTGHEQGSQGDMLSKLAQLENLRNPAKPAPLRGATQAASAPTPLVEGAVSETVGDPATPAWPGDVPGPGASSSPTSALARALAPLAGSAPIAPPAVTPPTAGSASTPAIAPPSQSESGTVRREFAPLPPAPPTGSARSRPTSLAASPIDSTTTTGQAAAAPTVVEARPESAPTPTIDGAVAPPLAVRFLHELRSRQRVETEALPMAFRPLAEEIAGSAPVTIAVGGASRRALNAVGRPAATVGSTIHLAERPDESSRSQQILAHELTHVAEPSAMPRFFDDPILSAEERDARRAEQLVRRAIRDNVAPTSAARGRSVGGAVPAVGERSAASSVDATASAHVIRRSPAGSAGSNTLSAQSLVDQAQGRTSSASSSTNDAVLRRSASSAGAVSASSASSSSMSSTTPSVRRAPAPEVDDSVGYNDASFPTMDEIVREVERRLTKKIIGERVRRGQSLRGRI